MGYSSDKRKLISLAKKIYNTHMSGRINAETRIKYSGPVYDDKEITNTFECLMDAFYSGWFSLGKYSKEFEKRLSSKIGVNNIVLTNSGSSANLLAVAGLSAVGRFKRGDEAITLAATFPTTVNPLILYGLKPVLVDMILPSYTINLEKLESAITHKTKLIMIPHINGSPNDMKAIMELARKHNIAVVEDCCDALGSKFTGKMVGSFGDVATFSFYGAHHISTGEGGAVATSDKKLADAIMSLRDWGRINITDNQPERGRKLEYQKISKSMPEDYEARYTYVNIGYNLKPLDIQFAMGIPQLDKLYRFENIRKANYRMYMEGLAALDKFIILPEALPDADASWFVFPMVIRPDASFRRKSLVEHMEKKNIETRPILAGNIYKHPAYRKVKFRIIDRLKNSDLILRNGLFCGVYQGLSEKKIRYAVESIRSFPEFNLQ